MRWVSAMTIALSLTAFNSLELASAQGDEDRDPSHNAALAYWYALLKIPAHPPRLTPWEVVNRSPLTASLTDAEFLLKKSGIATVEQCALADLRRGAKMPYCEWGLPIRENGPYTTAEHIQRSSTASGLLLVSARLEHSRGNWNAAVDDLNSAWMFYRFIAHDGTLFGWSIHSEMIKKKVAPLAAAWLPGLEVPALQRLALHLDHLPEPPSLSDAIRKEGDLWLEWMRTFSDREGVEVLRRELLLQSSNEEDLVRAAIEAATANPQELSRFIEETRSRFDEAARIASLPLEQFQPAAAKFQTEVASGNALARLTLEQIGKSQESFLKLKLLDAESKVLLMMFKAAIARLLHGPQDFQQVTDPFGTGPFQYVESEGGFTLTSTLNVDGKLFSTTFGSGAMPEPQSESQLVIYDPQVDSTAQILEAQTTASRENKRILLQWGFNGCISCYRLHAMFKEDGQLSEMLQRSFVRLSIDVTQEENHPLRKKYDADLPGVPHLTILDANGEVLANVKPSQYFYRNGDLDPGLIRDFLEKWSAPAVNDQSP